MTPDEDAGAPLPAGVDGAAPTQNSRLTGGNWLVRHWRGEETLGRSYWVNLVLIANLASTLSSIGFSQVEGLADSFREVVLAAIIFGVVRYIVWIWAVVGVVRSANKHTARGGTRFWADIARLIIAISVIGSGIRIVTSEVPGFRELAAIAIGHDPMLPMWSQNTFKPSTIWLQGVIGTGSAKEVQVALDAHPQATTVVLSSRGGRAWEAERIAELVKKRYLNTVVRGNCQSACTYILLAGNKRSVEEDGKIGFHRPYFPGTTRIGQQLQNRKMSDYYRDAGLPEWFIERTLATPSSAIWYPTDNELRKAHVLSQSIMVNEKTLSH
jgi:hypothetical protein